MSDPGFEALLEFLKRSRGFDFTGYKRASLERRFRRRMDLVGCGSFGDYLDFLEVHPDEFAQLFDTILINVTAFFRDPAAWDYIMRSAVPAIDQATGGRGRIRVWVAGCASGEEAYTTAIAFSETLGEDAFEQRVKVYATDADEDALTTARHGVYQSGALKSLSTDLRQKYFEQSGSRFGFRKDLRRNVIFGRHDLVQDAPISRLDLIVCRNTLMYFNAELQTSVLRKFQFGLLDHGLLFLGRAETLLTRGDAFTPVDVRHRVFTKRVDAARERMLTVAHRDGQPSLREVKLREGALDVVPVAQVLIDLDGALAAANQQARALFDIGQKDVGRPIQDLELSYRPLELRSRIETAYAERRPVQVPDVEYAYGNGEVQCFDVTVAPIFDSEANPLGVTATFTDVTRYRRLRQELERSNQELKTAYEELQSSNEELETTNEELQSAVEELETTNEELQSANEELETTNEELQSTNAEIQTINEDMRVRRSDLDDSNMLSDGIVQSLGMAVIVLDGDLRVRRWSDIARDMWGLRADEVEGVSIGDLDIGLPVSELEAAIDRCRKGEEQRLTVPATDRRGLPISCRVSCNPLIDADGQPHGVVLLVERLEE
jgi:two-component system, chemotaxis family, CheB/CheR fusion protein